MAEMMRITSTLIQMMTAMIVVEILGPSSDLRTVEGSTMPTGDLEKMVSFRPMTLPASGLY